MELDNLVLEPSRFSFHFKKKDIVALYHSVLMNLVYLNGESFRLYESFANGQSLENVLQKANNAPEREDIRSLVSDLYGEGYLVTDKDSDELILRKLRESKPISFQLMYVITTDICNLGCGYCFIENSMPVEYKHQKMTSEVFREGVNSFFGLSNKKHARKIIFYGGEPLVNRDIIELGLPYIRSHSESENTEINLISNGTLLDSTLAKLFKENDVKVSLSIDGSPQVHDNVRRYLQGRGTFSDVKRGYNNLIGAGFSKVGVSFTVGAHNLENLTTNVQYILDHFQVSGFGFNFLIDFPCRKNPFSVDISKATDKVLEAFDLLRKQGIYEDRIMRKLKPFVEKRFYFKDCGAIGNQLVLAPDGKVGPCHAFIGTKKYFDTSVKEGINGLAKNSVFTEWSQRMPINMQPCLDCSAISICGGGCPYNAFLNEGSIWGLDKRMCEHNKKLLEWFIWDGYQYVSKS